MLSLILGAGISGLGAQKLLKKMGEDHILFDDQVMGPGIINNVKDVPFAKLKKVVISPGFPPNHEFWAAIPKHSSIVIESEIDLGLSVFSGTVIGITGTNGKSTTTAMTFHILKKAGVNVGMGGNIGLSVCELMSQNGPKPHVLVLELSSYQLASSRILPIKFGAFLNFTADHIKWHGSLKNYFLAKCRIFTPAGLGLYAHHSLKSVAKAFGEKLPDGVNFLLENISDLDLVSPIFKERTNQMNALFAIKMASDYLKQDPISLVAYLSDFKPLEHRFEKLTEFLPNRFIINDSKATNVDSTINALSNIDRECYLFLGGIAKEESFEPIGSYKNVLKELFVFGRDREKIISELEKFHIPYQKFVTLEHCLSSIGNILLLDPNSPVVFAPGCASQDEFKNFEERGRFFKKRMNEILLK